jgi:hypothetical protein
MIYEKETSDNHSHEIKLLMTLALSGNVIL